MDEATGMERSAPEDVPGSLSLAGAVSLGTGVMIGAGIFALTGPVSYTHLTLPTILRV